MRNEGSIPERHKNEHGVALIIVLLVTALLIALIFEFAYGTRISLRAAVNFRDSERAYYLARSGVNFVGLLLSDNLKNGRPRDNLEQREWQPVPMVTGLSVRWEDESGKINITNVLQGNPTYNQLVKLFTLKGIDQAILNQIAEWQLHEIRKFYLLTELHQFMSDEDYQKIQDDVTLAPVSAIDINTASADVLGSIGVEAATVETIMRKRANDLYPYTSTAGISATASIDFKSDVFKVNSLATVGGYTKQIEAIIVRRANGTGADVRYWRSL